MTILFLLIPVTLVFLAVAIWAFFWAVKDGQYEDLESPAQRVLFDDDKHLDPFYQEKSNQLQSSKDSTSPTSENSSSQEQGNSSSTD